MMEGVFHNTNNNGENNKGLLYYLQDDNNSNTSSHNKGAGGGDDEGGFTTWRTFVWIIAGFFSCVAVLLSVRLIFQHARHFSCPIVQSKIMGILWMVPIYAVDSWLSLRFPMQAVYIDMFRDIYEAYVIYLFIALMIAFLRLDPDHPGVVRDESVVILQLRSVGEINHLPPVSYCLNPIKLDREFLRTVKFAAMQYVVLKPTLAVIATIMELNGVYKNGVFAVDAGYTYVAFLLNVSITFAFYYLVLFYVALHEFLRPYKPGLKFIIVKSVLFLSFWQSVALAAAAHFNIIQEFWIYSVEDVRLSTSTSCD